MRAHIVENGFIVNSIIVESLDFMSGLVESVGGEGIGWTYDGQTFTAPPSPLPSIPASVSRAQGKVALINAGLWPSVLAYVNAIADPTDKALAEVAINDTSTWDRASPTLNAMAYGLGMNDAQLDALLTAASEVAL